MTALTNQNESIYRFENFELDPVKRVLVRNGEVVSLTPKRLEILLVLVRNSGRVVDKDELMSEVWPDTIVEESNLTHNVSAVRKALGEKPGEHRFIVTIPGQGYRFVACVSEQGNGAEEILIERTRSRFVFEQDDSDEPVGLYPTVVEAAQLSRIENASYGAGPRPQLSAPAQETSPDSSRLKPFVIGLILACLFCLLAAGVVYRVKNQSSTRGTSDVLSSASQVSIKRLTTQGISVNATLSPDGKLFVYSTSKEGQQSLWLGHVDGSEPLMLRPPAEVSYRGISFVPDGSSLVYVINDDEHPRGALYKSPVFGGPPEKLRERINAPITFAPDGKRFAFVRSDEERGISSIVIATLTDQVERELASRPLARPFAQTGPSWSPDGLLIALGATSDDGSSSEVFLVTVADGETKPLTTSAWESVRSTEWLRDGSGLAIVAVEKSSWGAWQLWQGSYPDGKAVPIIPDLNSYGSPLSLSADDSALLAVQVLSMSNVWVAPAEDLSQASQITFSAYGRRDGWANLDWMPNGKLLYGAFIDQSLTLWAMNADGGDQRQLISTGYIDQLAGMTTDGRYLVFQSNRSGSSEIWRATSDGGELQQLTFGGNNTEPHVSPDGRWVVYRSASDGARALWRIPVEGGDATRLTDKDASWPRISPDGKMIACEYYPNPNLPSKLAIISVGGGEPIKIFDVPRIALFRYSIRWTPDGKAVTYRDGADGIWRQSLDGAAPNRLEGLPQERLYSYSWSPDGKLFAFTRGTTIRDVVLIRNFKNSTNAHR